MKNAIDREIVRDDLYDAIYKVIQKHHEESSNINCLLAESTSVHMTNAAMAVLDSYQDAYQQWKDDGYLSD